MKIITIALNEYVNYGDFNFILHHVQTYFIPTSYFRKSFTMKNIFDKFTNKFIFAKMF